MKATRFVLAVALMSFAVLAFSRPEPLQLSVKISLKKALENRSLVKSMHEQLDMSLLNQDGLCGIITARVKHKGVKYVIYGNYAEWRYFFLRDADLEVDPDCNSGP